MFNVKTKSKIAGVLFITATVTAISGLVLYDPILNNPDYLITGAENNFRIIFGAIFELFLVVSMIGTAVMMFPYLKMQDESLALAHVCFRFFEALIILIGIVSVLSLLSLSNDFTTGINSNTESYKASGVILKAMHKWTFMLGPLLMLSINTFLYSYLFYKSKLVPDKFSVLGMISATLVFISFVFIVFGIFPQISLWGIILAFPQFIFELILAVWLIVKGFDLTLLNSKMIKS